MYYRILFITILLSNIFTNLFGQQLRGTWLARTQLGSQAAIALAMDSLANNNFNVVYVNCWSRGYPLWQSSVFNSHTGVYIDPTYTGRDILAEAIAEGHRRGLLVEAWFEYGFVGGWTGNIPPGEKGPIFNAHPDWVAKKKDGTEMDANNFYWMIHTHPDAQNFLIAMATEICRNYDIDGIHMDRIRYSSLDYGYDSYTVSLYQSENGGSSPPTNTSLSSWIRWRADKLNQFIARLYDSVKSINQNILVSNAPSQYSSSSYTAYNSFCQDWMWWVDNNKVDYVTIQMYVSSSLTFASYIDYVKNNVTNDSKLFPSLAIKPGGTEISNTTLTQMLNSIQTKGLSGTAIWFYDDLTTKFIYLKTNHYSSAINPPFYPADWRIHKAVTPISNLTDAVRTGTWTSSSLPGYSGNSIYASSGSYASVDYYFSVPYNGVYEIYVYNVISSNRTTNAKYTCFYSGGSSVVYVDQTNINNDMFYKLGDFYLTAGRTKVITLDNSNLSAGKLLSADAAYISLNRNKTSGVPLPVELKYFKAELKDGYVLLTWETETEADNLGWDIEKLIFSNFKEKQLAPKWKVIGFVPGSINSNSSKKYIFIEYDCKDEENAEYRLKQTDADGKFTYSDVVKVKLSLISNIKLANYPNPFNPVTTISLFVPESFRNNNGSYTISLKIYDVLGREVETLINNYDLSLTKQSKIKFEWDASAYAAGIYFCRFIAKNYSVNHKMLLIK